LTAPSTGFDHAGAMSPFRPARLLLACCLWAALLLPASAQPQTVYPVRHGPASQSLNGTWTFKYVAGSDPGADGKFFEPAFDAAAWATIPVPSHWELQGFAEPKYGNKLADGTGLYRTTFHVPDNWAGGHRVFLRFDGVLYGFDAWVNGVKVGSWASSYNPVTFDVTDALKPGAANVLAVQVTTRSKGWEFDTNDCWALSGIYRDVTLFSTPATHFKDYTARTTLQPDGSAELHLDVQADRGTDTAPAVVTGRLVSPADGSVREFQFPLGADAHGETTLTIPHPALWTAETPSLYPLELALQVGGQSIQQISEKIGLRQVTIEQGVLKLNGVAIKLHGADHHDLSPDVGRALTEEHMLKDLALIKAANINFIRTSHYPPHPRFIELCDEQGIYVMCEVPFGYGDEHLTDASYQDILLTRARATVMRDKNRPSVIVWSVGNENPNTPLTFATGREVKRLDPTRPICYPQVGSYFGRTYADLPDFVDIYSPHYPVASTLRDYAKKLTRPIIVTEYAHQLGLASDRVQEEWEIMQANERYAGGSVWMFQDQGLLRTADRPYDRLTPTHYVWVDSRHYYDTSDMDGVDGIVYSDRTPQTDYWQVRKVYSPVQFPERSQAVHPGAQDITLQVENRFDFRTLAGINLLWSLQKNGVIQQSGVQPLKAAPHGHESVAIAVTLPDGSAGDVYALETSCVDETGRRFYERTIRLDQSPVGGRAAQLVAGLPSSGPKMTEAGPEVRIGNGSFEVRLNRQTGSLTLRDSHGQILADGLYPHVGRRFTMAEEVRARTTPIWKGSFLQNPIEPKVEVSTTAGGVQLTVHGKYPRNDLPEQFLEGEYTLLVTNHGSLEVTYNYAPTKATGTFLEVGLSLVAPASASELRWVGQGPYAGYPGKDRLNEFGLHHLNREDIRFQGNRREVEVAVLSSPAGTGLAVTGEAMDLAVENTADGVILSHNALLSGRGNKGSNPDAPLKADAIKQITGKFTLIPLDAKWPALLTQWFGQPSQPVEVQHPFYQSYDQ
jgi:beta-galactosidase